MLANRGDAVVAGTASADHLGVIDSHRRCKDVGRVAIVTGVCRLNVGRALADRIRAVMAADAVASDSYVIEIRRQPANGAVAVIAGIATGDMCWVLADRSGAVVAGTACANHLSVIDSQRRYKHVGRVAIVTGICR